MSNELIETHSLWRHKNKNSLYRVVTEGRLIGYASNKEKYIVYRALHGNHVWIRPKAEFTEKFAEINEDIYE